MEPQFVQLKNEIVSEIVTAMEGRFVTIDIHLDDIDSTLDSINLELRQHGIRLDEIDENIEILIEGQEVIHERLDRHDERITTLELR